METLQRIPVTSSISAAHDSNISEAHQGFWLFRCSGRAQNKLIIWPKLQSEIFIIVLSNYSYARTQNNIFIIILEFIASEE